MFVDEIFGDFEDLETGETNTTKTDADLSDKEEGVESGDKQGTDGDAGTGNLWVSYTGH